MVGDIAKADVRWINGTLSGSDSNGKEPMINVCRTRASGFGAVCYELHGVGLVRPIITTSWGQ
jgi:hypothetical protein